MAMNKKIIYIQSQRTDIHPKIFFGTSLQMELWSTSLWSCCVLFMLISHKHAQSPDKRRMPKCFLSPLTPLKLPLLATHEEILLLQRPEALKPDNLLKAFNYHRKLHPCPIAKKTHPHTLSLNKWPISARNQLVTFLFLMSSISWDIIRERKKSALPRSM